MYVCVCNAVTDREIHEAVDRGAASLADVQRRLPVANCCGRCEDTAQNVVDQYIRDRVRPSAA